MRMGSEKSKVTLLASIRARSSCTTPSISQHAMPTLSIRYMIREISSVFRVRRVSRACGRKENVVSAAASKPICSIVMPVSS